MSVVILPVRILSSVESGVTLLVRGLDDEGPGDVVVGLVSETRASSEAPA